LLTFLAEGRLALLAGFALLAELLVISFVGHVDSPRVGPACSLQ
jgi:hypothetical protein